jgi:hypothetical protein
MSRVGPPGPVTTTSIEGAARIVSAEAAVDTWLAVGAVRIAPHPAVTATMAAAPVAAGLCRAIRRITVCSFQCAESVRRSVLEENRLPGT